MPEYRQCVICGEIKELKKGADISNFMYPDDQICRTCAEDLLREQLKLRRR